MHISSAWRFRMPHAVNDAFAWTEDQASAYQVGTNVLSLDVLANDRGGHAARLYSIDDGDGRRFDWHLLARDVGRDGVSTWERTDDGNLIRIDHGRIELDLSHSLSALGATDLNAMAAGDVIDDDFVYAIQLGRGAALSQAHVHVHIEGVNDPAAISGTATGTVTEDGAIQIRRAAR